jgi:hypothetical protein
MAEIDPRIEEFLARQGEPQGEDPRIEEFLARQKKASKMPETPAQVLNESSDIPWEDRIAVKNFGGDIQDQVNYLKQKNAERGGGLEISTVGDEIVARKPGEKNWKKLDPTGITSAQEAIQDLTDVGYDLVDATLSTIATGASGLAGGILGGGVGAIPAAIAGGGAASAGLEGIRQAIGKYAFGKEGPVKEISGSDIAISGALGALPVPFVGGGASAKQIKEAVKNPSIVRRVLDNAKIEFIPEGVGITKSQKAMARDILSQSQEGFLSKLPKGALGGVSGVPAETLSAATDKADPVIVKSLYEKGNLKLNPNKTYTNLELSDWLEKGGLDSLGRAAEKEVDKVNTALRKTGSQIEVALNKAQKKGVTVPIAKFSQPFDNLFMQLDSAAKESDSLALREAADKISVLRNKYFKQGVDEVSPKTAFALKNELADLIDFSRGPLQVGSQLESAISSAEKGLRDSIYDKIGGDDIRKAYAEHSDIKEGMYKFFKNKDVAVNTLKNPETLRSPTFKAEMKKFDKNYKANLSGLSDVAVTWKYFGRPPAQPIVGGGSGQVWRGAGAGAALAGSIGTALAGPMGGALGVGLGGLAGSFATSPLAIKKGLLQPETAVSRMAESVAGLPGVRQTLAAPVKLQRQLPVGLQALPSAQGIAQFTQETGAIPSAWDLMWQLNQGEQK